jgi:hypothetical protein
MLLFRSEAQVQEWCATWQVKRGQVLPLSQVWELSKAWYADRMHPDFRGRTPDKVVQIFESVGLISPFWKPVS